MLKVTEQVKAISERWKALDEAGRRPYLEKAAADKERYQAEKAALAAVGKRFIIDDRGVEGVVGWWVRLSVCLVVRGACMHIHTVTSASTTTSPVTHTQPQTFQAKAKAAAKSKKKGPPGPRGVDNEMHFPVGAFTRVCVHVCLVCWLVYGPCRLGHLPWEAPCHPCHPTNHTDHTLHHITQFNQKQRGSGAS